MDAEHVISQIQRELDAEVIYQNRKLQMGLAEIKERLKTTLPLSMNYNNGNQVFHFGNKTVELSGSPTDDQIVTALTALENPFTSQAAIKMAKSPLQGLGQKLGLAKHNAELDAAKISAKVDELEARREAATPKVMAGLEAQGQDIGELETFVADMEKATNQ